MKTLFLSLIAGVLFFNSASAQESALFVESADRTSGAKILIVDDSDTGQRFAAAYDESLSIGQEVEYVVVEKERGITINTSHVEWEEIIIIKFANASEVGIENSNYTDRKESMAFKSGKGVIVGTQGTAF